MSVSSDHRTAMRIVKRHLARLGGPDLGWTFEAEDQRLVDEIAAALGRAVARAVCQALGREEG